MKGYAVIQGPRRKVLAVSLDTFWCKYVAASNLDYEAISGISGSHHNIGRVLREHKAKVIRIDFDLLNETGGVA